LLLIHGGPGYVSIPMSWWFSRGWEEYFTVVQWDQRAAGKTYLLTDPAKIASSLTTERMTSDIEEMAAWGRAASSQKTRSSSLPTVTAAFSACSSRSATPNGSTRISVLASLSMVPRMSDVAGVSRSTAHAAQAT